jgi:hypothetical protein
MVMYRVVLNGVPILETRDRTFAAEMAEYARCELVAFDHPPERVYTRRLWWGIASLVALYVVASIAGRL